MPNFRRQLSSAWFFFNKLSLDKKFIRKVERLNVKQRRSRWDGSYEPIIIIAYGSERVKASFGQYWNLFRLEYVN